MAGLADQPFKGLLDFVASTDPAPGGGSSAALAAALGAALLHMTSCLELTREAPDPALAEEIPERARALREEALALADREMSSYAPVLDALRLPESDPERAERLGAALTEASRAPVAIAEAAAETAELGARVTAAS